MQFVIEEFVIIMFILFILIYVFSAILIVNIYTKNLYKLDVAVREGGVNIPEVKPLGSFSIKVESDAILKVKPNKLYNE